MTAVGSPTLSLQDCVNDVCPWSGKPVSASALTTYPAPDGTMVVVGFCNPDCRDKFEAATTAFNRAVAGKEGGK